MRVVCLTFMTATVSRGQFMDIAVFLPWVHKNKVLRQKAESTVVLEIAAIKFGVIQLFSFSKRRGSYHGISCSLVMAADGQLHVVIHN